MSGLTSRNFIFWVYRFIVNYGKKWTFQVRGTFRVEYWYRYLLTTAVHPRPFVQIYPQKNSRFAAALENGSSYQLVLRRTNFPSTFFSMNP
jgi:hypothetical protein